MLNQNFAIPFVRSIMTACIMCALLLLGLSGAHGADKKGGSQAKSSTLSAQSKHSLELNEQGVAAVQRRDYASAESLFRRALDTDDHNITAVFNLAGVYITNKKESQAIPLLTKYSQLFPKDAGLMARLGDAYFSSQNPKNAITSYEKALALDGSYPGVAARLGTLYALQNKLAKAATMYERAVKENPRDANALQNLSNLYLGLGKPQQAITTAKKALQISSTAEAYVTLGNAYQELKDDRNALISFQRAKELGHKDPALSKVIESLEERTTKGTT